MQDCKCVVRPPHSFNFQKSLFSPSHSSLFKPYCLAYREGRGRTAGSTSSYPSGITSIVTHRSLQQQQQANDWCLHPIRNHLSTKWPPDKHVFSNSSSICILTRKEVSDEVRGECVREALQLTLICYYWLIYCLWGIKKKHGAHTHACLTLWYIMVLSWIEHKKEGLVWFRELGNST